MSSLNYSVKSHSFKKEHALCVLLGLVIGLIIAYLYHNYASSKSEELVMPSPYRPQIKGQVASR